MTPSEYLHSIGVSCPTKPPAYPHNWCSATVADILDRQEYTGDTVNFRSFSQSFKQKKRLDKPQEEWKIFPDTHPAIIDRETFALVQELRQHRRRPTKSGIISIFSGLLYCADCGDSWYWRDYSVFCGTSKLLNRSLHKSRWSGLVCKRKRR